MKRQEKKIYCPLCLSTLNELNGFLVCSKTKHKFEIKNGIPILLDYPNLPTHSQNQQNYFEKKMKKLTISSFHNMNNWKIQYLKRFGENFEKIKNKSVIEVGVGDGYMAIGLAKLGAKVTACDITVTNLVALKQLGKALGLENSLTFICCSADKLPFKNSSADYYVLNSVLEHIPEEEKAISEIKRVIKKGGGLMITVPVKYEYIFPPLLPLNFFHDKRIGHLRRYDEVSLKNKLIGFKMKRTYFTGHPLRVLKVVINMIFRIFDEQVMEIEDSKSI